MEIYEQQEDGECVKTKSLEFKEKAKGNRKMKLIFCRLPQAQFISLVKASAKEAMVTGDSSTIEAIALGKIFFYEYRFHKEPFIKAFIRLASKIDERFQNLLQDCFIPKEMETYSNTLIIHSKGIPLEIEAYFKAMQDPELQDNMDRVREKIAKEHSFAPVLCQIIKEKLPDIKEKFSLPKA